MTDTKPLKDSSASICPGDFVSQLANIFALHGHQEYLGEPVTMAEHMLQAATLAAEGGMDDTMVVAALLHDIGHFTGQAGLFTMADSEDRRHEETGAEFLAPYLPPLVVQCVRHHVAAKRYLCAVRPEYTRRLSEASIVSLNLQGGPMSAAEVAVFNELPYRAQIVQVRHLDDAAKRPGITTPGFDEYAPLIQHLVDQHVAAS